MNISVIVPVYNVESYLSCCLDSILNQSFTNFECIVINDGSTDKSGEICEQYALKDSRIKVIHKKNGGLSDARNTGLDIASGKYIYFVDSDDWIHPDALSSLFFVLEKYNLDVAAFMAVNCYSNGKKKLNSNFFKLENDVNILKIGGDGFVFRSLFFASSCFKMYRTDFLNKKNIRFIYGVKYEDNHFWVMIMKNITHIAVLNKHYYYYRCARPCSIMRKRNFSDLPFAWYSIQKLVFTDERFCQFRSMFGQIIYLMAMKFLVMSESRYRKIFLHKIRMLFRKNKNYLKQTSSHPGNDVFGIICSCGIWMLQNIPYCVLVPFLMLSKIFLCTFFDKIHALFVKKTSCL